MSVQSDQIRVDTRPVILHGQRHGGSLASTSGAREAAQQLAVDSEPARAAEPAVPQSLGSTADGWSKRYAHRLIVTDLLALIWAGVGVQVVFLNSHVGTRLDVNAGRLPVLLLTVLLVAAWFCALTLAGTRLRMVVGHGATEYKRIVQTTLTVFGSVAIISYLFDLQLPRSLLLVMAPAGLAALLLSRFAWRRWLQVRRDFGHYQLRVLAVGSMSTVDELIRGLKRSPRAGYRVIGVCLTDRGAGHASTLDGIPIVGDVDDVRLGIDRTGADIVAVTSTTAIGPSFVRELSWQLEDTQVGLVLAPALTDIAGPRIHTQPVNGLPLIHVDKPTYRGANRLLKKSFDIVVATALLLALGLPMLAIALLVKITDRGPVFFRQTRVGLNGELFGMIKFRSMVPDAESKLAALQSQSNGGNDVLFKMTDDPRVTRIGRILRRFSLDELPQLFNVLGGTMSLVGPRPPLVKEVAQYGSSARRRLLVKPGMTGLWQVSGRSNLSWDETVRLDCYYVENWSIVGDLVILWKTAKAVVSGGGAY